MIPEETCDDMANDIASCDLCDSIDEEAEEDGGCGGGCIAGIVIGCVAGVALVIGGVFFACSGAAPASQGFEMV